MSHKILKGTWCTFHICFCSLMSPRCHIYCRIAVSKFLERRYTGWQGQAFMIHSITMKCYDTTLNGMGLVLSKKYNYLISFQKYYNSRIILYIL